MGFEFNYGARFFPQSACLFLPRPSPPPLLPTPIGVFSLFPHCGNWQRKKKTYIPPFLLFSLSLSTRIRMCVLSPNKKKKKKSTIACTPGRNIGQVDFSSCVLISPKGRGLPCSNDDGEILLLCGGRGGGCLVSIFFIALFFCAKMREAE